MPDYKRRYSITWDAEIPGFGAITTNVGTQSYIVRARIKGKERRKTIGRASVLATEKARQLAKVWLGRICEGGDPVTEDKLKVVGAITLQDAIESYCNSGRVRKSTAEISQRFFHCPNFNVLLAFLLNKAT